MSVARSLSHLTRLHSLQPDSGHRSWAWLVPFLSSGLESGLERGGQIHGYEGGVFCSGGPRDIKRRRACSHWQNCTTVCPNGTVVSSYKTQTRSNGQVDYDYQGCVNATGGKVDGARGECATALLSLPFAAVPQCCLAVFSASSFAHEAAITAFHHLSPPFTAVLLLSAIPWHSDGTDPAQGPYGTPQWDTHRFPDVRGMVAKGHSLGLRPGWYMGNCK